MDRQSYYQRLLKMALERHGGEGKGIQPAEPPQGLQAFQFGYLHGMLIRLIEELKQHKDETAVLKERIEWLEAKLNQ